MEPVSVTPVERRQHNLGWLWPWRVQLAVWQKVTVIGLAMPLLYWVGIVLPYPLAFGLANPRGSWVKAREGSLAALAWHIGVYLLLTLLYVAALRLLRTTSEPSRTPRQTVIWLSWVLCCGVLLFAAPNGESHDIYDYVFRGRMIDRYAASPLQVTPNAYPKAPFYRYVAWKRHVDTYGPLWEYASVATSRTVRIGLQWTGAFSEQSPGCPQSILSCRTLAAYLTGYRQLAILLTGLAGLLLWKIINATQPTLAPYALAIWLWNPLLLMSTALGAHNDALLVLLFFLTYGLWQRGYWLLGWLALGLATQVKLTALLLVPALGLWLVRKIGWLRAIGISLVAGGITLGLSWLLYAPLGGWATLPRMLYERQLFVAHSLAQILYFWLYKWSSWSYGLVWQMMVVWAAWLFLAVAALLLLRTFQHSTFREEARKIMASVSVSGLFPEGGAQPRQSYRASQSQLYRTCTLLTLLYLLLGSFWFQPWYFVWVLVPAALWVDGRFPYRGLPWVCFGALCSNVVYDHVMQLPSIAEPTAPLFRLGVTVLVVLTIWLPLLLAQSRWVGKK